MRSAMKRIRIITVLVLVTALLAGLFTACTYKMDKSKLASTLYVKKVEGLPKDFIMAMDASSVISEEAAGVKFYGMDGSEQDVFKTLAQAGINYIRVRVWNDPYDENGNGFGGGNCDIETAIEIGKRASRYNMKLLVDFHYSDFWADPSKQMCPRAWQGMSIEEKAQACYDYTYDCLTKLKNAGVKVGMVQVGNETNGMVAGEKIWMNMYYIFDAGSRAVRKVFPKAMVAVHFANPEKASAIADYAKKLDYYALDYDVFGCSYYPVWHGTLDNLKEVLDNVTDTYGKKVMIMETSYPYTDEDSDFFGNSVSSGSGITKDYPFTVQGQANCIRDIVQAAADMKSCIGVSYWEGTWIAAGGSSFEENSALWEQYGCGWASSYAKAYDPGDAGRYYGGSAVDNQAMFSPQGYPLESLKIFNLVRYGNKVDLAADALEDVSVSIDLNGSILLPMTVNAVMNDGSKEEIPVEWNITDADMEMMKNGGVRQYHFTGTAGGMEANLYVDMIEFNFLSNHSFEDGIDAPWIVRANKKMDELKIEEKQTDSKTGKWHYHFWSAAKNSVDFDLEQEVKGLESGKYKYTLSIMGGDGGDTDIYMYVKIDGTITEKCPMHITSWNSWETDVIDSFEYREGQELIVGVHVECEGSGNGAWGKIDDALLNSVKE